MFKLFDIEFIDHPFFKNLKVDFADHKEGWAKNYTTLIIGPNGTGKSKILQAVIAIFNSLEFQQNNSKKKYSFFYHYKLNFGNNGRFHAVEYTANKLIINGSDDRDKIGELILPKKILVSAFSFNDKYPLREQRGKVTNERYYYLGLKSTTNNVFIGNPTKNAISNLYNAIIYRKDILPLKEAFTTLELRPELRLVYKPGKHFKLLQNNDFWENKSLTPSEFTDSYLTFVDRKKRKSKSAKIKRLGNEKINRIIDDTEKLEIVIDFLKENIRLVTALENKEISLKPSINFLASTDDSTFVKFVEPFQTLSDLELISFSRFDIKKLESSFSFDDASSGEYHIILTFLNILSLLEDNSLVLLDEPEISLHPNWQIKYMTIFYEVFKRFPKTHFIIASHSHFLVSDLKAENSSILAIDQNENGEIKISPTPKNTYGWSAEQILLEVFKVSTTRNYFVADKVGEILELVSQIDRDDDKIRQKVKDLIDNNITELSDEDPLKPVINRLVEKYG